MKKIILLVVIIAALFIAVFFGYRYLSENFSPEEPISESSASETSGGEISPENGSASSEGSSLPEVSKTADFTVTNAAGESVKLSDYFGKPIVVNLWASWCGPCKAELPDFEEAYAEYTDVVFMMVNVGDSSLEEALSFAEGKGYTFPVYYDTDGSASLAYSVYSIPMTLFINSDGSLSETKIGTLSAEKIASGIENILDK